MCGALPWKLICVGLLLIVYSCIDVGDPVIKRGQNRRRRSSYQEGAE